jgi:iron complex outermembrane receptor protein
MKFATRQIAIRVVALVVVAASPAAALSAQDLLAVNQAAAVPSGRPLRELSLEELGNIEVVSTRKQPESVRRTAAAIYVITQDDIRRSGATTLPDALRLAPGVIVNQSDSNRWAVGIRGFADIFSKSVLVLIDGRSVYTPLVGGVHWAVQDVMLGDVERIEVIRGAGGSIWGANAVNGIINVITRNAADSQGLRLTAAAGGVEQGRLSARYGGRAAGMDYRVYAKVFSRAAQFHADGTDFDAWHAAQSGFRADWNRSAESTVTLSGDLYSTRTGERADVSFYTPPSVQTIDGRLDLTGGNLTFRWQQTLAGGGSSRLQAYYDRTNRDGFTFGEVRNTLDVDYNLQLPIGHRQTLSFGAGGRISPSTITQVVPTLNFLPNAKTGTLASLFAQDDIALLPERLALELGAKVERNNYTGAEVLPSARVVATPGRNQTFWASITRSIRTPSRFERDLSFELLADPRVPVYVELAGSAEFGSESVVGTEAGYRTLLATSLYVDVAAFYDDYADLAGFGNAALSTSFDPVPRLLLTLPFANSVQATTRGIEISPDWKPLSVWQLKGSYSYLNLRASNDAGFTDTSQRDNYVGLAPHHQVRVQSRLDLTPRVELDQTYRYVSALPAQQVPAYATLDARVAWKVSPAISVSLVGQNLLQPHHQEFNAVPVEIRRSAYIQATFQK